MVLSRTFSLCDRILTGKVEKFSVITQHFERLELGRCGGGERDTVRLRGEEITLFLHEGIL